MGGCLIVIWFVIAFSFLRLHPQLEAAGELTHVRMWAPGVLPWATVALAAVIVALMATTPDGRFQILAVAVVVGVITAAGVIYTSTPTFRRNAAEATERNIR